MKTYKERIINVTGCAISDVKIIEDYMRDIVLHSTLDWLSESQFNKSAKTAYNDILYMRSSEGIKYMEQLTLAYL